MDENLPVCRNHSRHGSFAAAQRLAARQTIAPHELRASVAPPAIVWDTPPELRDGPVEFDSAEERELRLVVVTKGLELLRIEPRN